MTKRERLDDPYDDDEPTHRPRRRITTDVEIPSTNATYESPSKGTRSNNGHGESKLSRRFDNPVQEYFLHSENRNKAGRPKGSMNQFTRRLKEALELSTGTAGEELIKQGHRYSEDPCVNYLTWLALHEPSSHARLISIVTPKVVHTAPDPESALGQFLDAARAKLAFEKTKTIEARAIEGDRWKREYR
jgi:hypothetical protein